MKEIHMFLTYKWFDLVNQEKKTEEYRKYNSIWRKRLKKIKIGDKIIFHRGYTKQICICKITSIEIIRSCNLPHQEFIFFGCPNEELYFKIKIKKEK